MPVERFQRSLWWIKRDVRLNDNPALQAALARSGQVLPTYILEPSLWRALDASAMQLFAVLQALADLQQKPYASGQPADAHARGVPGGPLEQLPCLSVRGYFCL